MNNTDKKSLSKTAGLILFALFLIYLLTPSSYSKNKEPELPIPVVLIQKPKWEQTVDYVTQTGTTVAYNSVDLVARIEGFLRAIQFTDGSFVKKGAPLFIIQPEPYMEQWKAAKSTVAANKAIVDYSKLEYERQKRMYKENATSLNNVEKWQAKTLESQAELDKAIANEAIAGINYSYTHIEAPFDGRIGRHLVDIGNLVGNGKATDLATIEQINPLFVYFNLNEIDLIRLRQVARARGFKDTDINQVPVDVSLQTDDAFKYKAVLNFINTGLNAGTGTMEFRAILDNKNLDLVPGLFVQIRIPLSLPRKQLTVPDTAILYDQIGPYLLTVNDKNTVILQRVRLGSVNQGRRAIVQGLGAEDRVIVEGLQNASLGARVNPHDF